MSIHWPIIRQLLRHPLRTFIVDDQRSYRGVDILAAALHVADAVESRSRAGRTGILLPTGGGFPIAALAVWMLGRTPVPLNYLLKADELRFVIEDSGIDAVVTAGPMLDFLATGAGVAPAPPSSADHAALGIPPGVGLIRLDALNFRSVPSPRWPARPDPADLGVLLYTSGTSGRPKGVMLTHANIRANVLQCTEFLEVDHREVILGVLPQFHSFGLTVLTLLPLSLGAKAVYTARFVPGKLLRLIREHSPTIFVAIPSMYNALLHAKGAAPEDFRTLRLPVSGGEPLPRALAESIRDRFGLTITEGYGLTETAPVTNVCRPWEFRPGSVGRPLPGVVERIVDIESGEDLPPGRDGEVRIAGPNIMKGYLHRPEETAAAFDSAGFFRTGDIGRFDEAGHLHITGRLKEMLIVGGENVFPREIEEVLNSHPSIKDSGVVGRPDPMRGEVPLAFVELREPGPDDKAAPALVTEKELLAWCRARLAGYKVPGAVRFVGALPRNATGKVMRRELKEKV